MTEPVVRVHGETQSGTPVEGYIVMGPIYHLRFQKSGRPLTDASGCALRLSRATGSLHDLESDDEHLWVGIIGKREISLESSPELDALLKETGTGLVPEWVRTLAARADKGEV